MSKIINNSFWLLLSQLGGLFIPLIELPILSRALGQESYGQVLYALGISLTASIFIEFGFNFSAARSLVKLEGQPEKIAQLVTNVLVAKILLSICVISVVLTSVIVKSGETSIPIYWFFWISISILAFGFTPLWYFIGTQRLIFPAVLDLGLRSIGLLFTYLLVKNPENALRVVIIQAVVGFINTILPTLIMLRKTKIGSIDFKAAIAAIKESWEFFLYKSMQSIMGSIASTMIGILNGPRGVAMFVPAEKLVRASTGLAAPLMNAVFPYFTKLQKNSQHAVKKIVIKIILINFIFSCFAAILISYLAETIIETIFGSGYEQSVFLLKILVWVIPLRLCNITIAILWLIPTGKEKIASRVMIFNILIILILSIILVPTMSGLGMTITFLISEVISSLILLTVLFKCK